MLVAYAIWLAHKTSDLYAELKVLSDRGGQFARIAAQIQVPERGTDATLARTGPGPEEDLSVADTAPSGASSSDRDA